MAPLLPRPTISDPDQILTNAFLSELEANCRMCLDAWNELLQLSLAPPRAGPSDSSQAEMRRWVYSLWAKVYAMTGAARRISRVLWTWESSGRLRADLKLNLSAHLRENAPVVKLRDALEHTESRIPDFARQAGDQPLSGWGVTNNPEDNGPLPPTRFRHLNYLTWRCSVRDSDGEYPCNLREVAESAQRLAVSLPVRIGGTATIVWSPPP